MNFAVRRDNLFFFVFFRFQTQVSIYTVGKSFSSVRKTYKIFYNIPTNNIRPFISFIEKYTHLTNTNRKHNNYDMLTTSTKNR